MTPLAALSPQLSVLLIIAGVLLASVIAGEYQDRRNRKNSEALAERSKVMGRPKL